MDAGAVISAGGAGTPISVATFSTVAVSFGSWPGARAARYATRGATLRSRIDRSTTSSNSFSPSTSVTYRSMAARVVTRSAASAARWALGFGSIDRHRITAKKFLSVSPTQRT